jgi:phosphate transport system substrate-binding protein
MSKNNSTTLKLKVAKFALSATIAAMLCNRPAYADDLVLQGSTTFTNGVTEPYAKAVEAQTGNHLEVITNRSSLGLLALFEHKADLAMISTTLDSEVQILQPANPDLPFQKLKAFEIARTRAGLVVHPSNRIRHLRLEEVRKILSGEISNWAELGGEDLPIRVVAVHEGGGVIGSVESRLFGKGHLSAPNAIRVQQGTQIVRVVEQEPGAFGITERAIVKSSAAVEITTDEPIEQILSLVSIGEPTPAEIAVIAAFRRLAKSGA